MRALVIGILLSAALAAAYLSQHATEQPSASPAPVMGMLADAQRAAARVPVAAERPSDADEMAIGQRLLATRRTDASTPRAAYVATVGARVAAGAHRRMPYSFHLIEDDQFVNAYAVPGGAVYIGSGLLVLMHTEDELAAVLAHEVEHIDHYHCIDRYAQARAAGQIPVLGALAQLPVALFEAGYAKTQELEADADGTRLTARAGYAPLAIVALLRAMEERRGGRARRTSRPASPVDEVLSVPGDALHDYFRSHPPEAERIAHITDVVTSDRLVGTQALTPLSLPPRTPAPTAPSGQDGP